jgi:hypothetical protein
MLMPTTGIRIYWPLSVAWMNLESRKLIELDPFDLINNVHLSWHHYMAREFPAAISEAQRTLAMEKRFHWGYFFAGLALDAAGEHRDALKHLRTSLNLSG